MYKNLNSIWELLEQHGLCSLRNPLQTAEMQSGSYAFVLFHMHQARGRLELTGMGER